MKKARPPEGPDGEPCSCSAIRKAARRITQLYDEILAPAGLRITQYALLSNVGRHEPVSMTALAEALAMDRTTLTRNVAPLEREGLLSIRPTGHGRTKVANLTPRGRSLLRTTRPYWHEAQERFSQILGREQTQALIALAGQVERAGKTGV